MAIDLQPGLKAKVTVPGSSANLGRALTHSESR